MENRFFYSKYKPKHENVTEIIKTNMIGSFVSETAKGVTSLINDKHSNEEIFSDIFRDIVISGLDYSLNHVIKDQIEHQFINNWENGIKDIFLDNIDFTLNFSKSLFNYSLGKIDADELLSNTLSNVVVSTMSTLGAKAFTLVSNSVGFGASIGTALGPLGTIVGSVLGGLIGATIVSSAKEDGLERFKNQLDQLNTRHNNQPSIYKYLDVAGTMSEYNFSFKFLVPCYGTIGVLSEYRAKKQVLQKIKTTLQNPDFLTDSDYYNFMDEINNQFSASNRKIRKEMSASRVLYNARAEEYVGQLSEEVNQYVFSKTNSLNIVKNNFIDQVYQYQHVFNSIENRKSKLYDLQGTIEALKLEIEDLDRTANKEYYLRMIEDITNGVIGNQILMPIEQAELFFS
ncbi:hypothetical protein [Labilibaculum euxinus]